MTQRHANKNIETHMKINKNKQHTKIPKLQTGNI